MDPRIRSTVLFDVDADVPHREITAATERALAAAREALGAAVEAEGALGTARDAAPATRRVRIELAMRATPAAALAAERAFADAFLARMASRGFGANRAAGQG